MSNQWWKQKQHSFKMLVNKFFAWGQNATSSDPLRFNPHIPAEGEWTMRVPQYFPDIDTLANLITKLAKLGSVKVNIGGEYALGEYTAMEIADIVAHKPLPMRKHFVVIVIDENNNSSSIEFIQSASWTESKTKVHGYSEQTRDSIAHALTTTTSPISRKNRKNHVPLIEPFRAEDDARTRRDYEITKAARRSGALSGFLTAFAVAVITIVIPALMDKS